MLRVLRRKKSGFTLVEILVVVVLLAVLGALVIPRILGRVEKAKEAEAFMNLGAIRSSELLLHNLSGKFVAAENAAAIKDALGLSVEGLFYSYKIIDVTDDNFLAVATPLDLLESWLQDYAIDKNGFVGYNPSSGGGRSGGGSGSSGGSSGGSISGGLGGSSGGGTGGSSGTMGGGSGNGSVAPIQDHISKPPFTGYAENAQAVLDTLAFATGPLTSDAAVSGKALSEYAQAHEWPITFLSRAALTEFCESSSALGCQGPMTDGSSSIALLDDYLGNKYAAAAIVGHEILHAIWWEDYAAYYYPPHTKEAPTIGVPPDGGIRHSYSEDQEYNTKKAGGEIWLDLRTKYPDQVYDDAGLWWQLASDEQYFVGVPEDEAKGYLGSIYRYNFDYLY